MLLELCLPKSLQTSDPCSAFPAPGCSRHSTNICQTGRKRTISCNFPSQLPPFPLPPGLSPVKPVCPLPQRSPRTFEDPGLRFLSLRASVYPAENRVWVSCTLSFTPSCPRIKVTAQDPPPSGEGGLSQPDGGGLREGRGWGWECRGPA